MIKQKLVHQLKFLKETRELLQIQAFDSTYPENKPNYNYSILLLNEQINKLEQRLTLELNSNKSDNYD